MPAYRRPLIFNPTAKCWTAPPSHDASTIRAFHQTLPDYKLTPLVSLEHIAEEIGVGAVYVKDESSRLSLPAFKILGASWGTYRAVLQKLSLSIGSAEGLDKVGEAARASGYKLFASTAGNHGRAVARMGALLGVPVQIHVPNGTHPATQKLIRGEGAVVTESKGSYNLATLEAQQASEAHAGGILVQDDAVEGYEHVVQWIVQGYQTMMLEIDEQLGDIQPDLIICPVGVGSLAQAVVTHFKQSGKSTTMMTVEPDTAACMWRSMKACESTTTATTHTIMAGLNCGTVSSTAWPLLSRGVDVGATVSDYEAHVAAIGLQTSGVPAGPCGAAPLAALRRLTVDDKSRLGLTKSSSVVLLCTERTRDYGLPVDVSVDDVAELTQKLVQINSASPTLGFIPGPGEMSIARYIKAWLEYRDIESYWIETIPGRPSVVGVAKGSGGGKSIMFDGHIDTVTLSGYEGDPLSGKIESNKLYGRGAADMKCGVAAALVALARVKAVGGLRGDVTFAGVADEEDSSIGTEDVLKAGFTADAAIVSEPTGLSIVNAHKGFVWLEVDVHGVAAHGSRPDLGVDAICKAGAFLTELAKYDADLRKGPEPGAVGRPSVHASTIKGGEEVSSYPALCKIALEYRTVPGQTPYSVKKEIETLLKDIAENDPSFKYDIRVTFDRPPFSVPLDSPLLTLVKKHVGDALGREPDVHVVPYWTDCALLDDAGIPAVLWGPKGEGFHAKKEWLDVESVKTVSDTLFNIATDFCA